MNLSYSTRRWFWTLETLRKLSVLVGKRSLKPDDASDGLGFQQKVRSIDVLPGAKQAEERDFDDEGAIKLLTFYFMSIPEASQLVIQSAAMCQGGEIYVLDMGEPVNITQLAEDLVTLSGLPVGSIEFQFTSIHPGEKLYEELCFDEEATLATPHPQIRAAYHRAFLSDNGADEINALIKIADLGTAGVAATISVLVPSFHTAADEAVRPETAADGARPRVNFRHHL